jgi:hypothetical protein
MEPGSGQMDFASPPDNDSNWHWHALFTVNQSLSSSTNPAPTLMKLASSH